MVRSTLIAGILFFASQYGAQSARLELDPQRKAYVHLMRGKLQVNGQSLCAGDAALIEGESSLTVAQGQDAEVLVFDLAP